MGTGRERQNVNMLPLQHVEHSWNREWHLGNAECVDYEIILPAVGSGNGWVRLVVCAWNVKNWISDILQPFTAWRWQVDGGVYLLDASLPLYCAAITMLGERQREMEGVVCGLGGQVSGVCVLPELLVSVIPENCSCLGERES
jgi:hypothetical protein